ncbi:MAG: GrpB family protein [Bacteroidota bacterium]
MQIIVSDYNPNWPLIFQKEAKTLSDTLGNIIIKVHHIGSTSVPGLKAKPIIDIILEVVDLEALDQQNGQMEMLGYEVKGEYGIPGRRYFRKGRDRRTHHIHSFQTGDDNILRHVAFRDYLIAHPEIAEEYAQLKTAIAARCNNDRERYCDEKDPFIQEHEKRAIAWTKQNTNNG